MAFLILILRTKHRTGDAIVHFQWTNLDWPFRDRWYLESGFSTLYVYLESTLLSLVIHVILYLRRALIW
jgi:hypothetical protein